MTAGTTTEIERTPRSRWRRALALAVAPLLIWAPVFTWITAEDNMEAGRPFALVILGVLLREAPFIYGLYGLAGLAVVLAGRGRPRLRMGSAVLVLFGLACTALAGLGVLVISGLLNGLSGAGSALVAGVLAGVCGIPVALAYSLIAGVRWR